MQVVVSRSPEELGARAAEHAAVVIREALERQGTARVVFSTGKSQLDTIDALVGQDVDWSRVEGFHLDEYVGLSDSHPASFRRYLRDRLVSRLPFRTFHFVSPEGDLERALSQLTEQLRAAPVDLGLIGIFPVEDREICSRVMAACEESDDYADAEEKATVVGTCLSMLRQRYEV